MFELENIFQLFVYCWFYSGYIVLPRCLYLL